MQTTTNYEMRKPEYTDTADIADINYNTDKIDEVLKTLDDRTDPVDVAHGGTGQTTVAAARNALAHHNRGYVLILLKGLRFFGSKTLSIAVEVITEACRSKCRRS